VLLVGTWLWIFLSRGRDHSLSLFQQQISGFQEQISRAMTDLSSASNREIQQLHQRLDQRLQETSQLIAGTNQSVGERIDQNTRLFGQVQTQLGRMEELGKGIQSVGHEISELQDILRAPKLRGNLGELFLEELLGQILPKRNYEMQYMFKSGEKVDAIIRLADGHLVPIDAKFPLENFQRMLKEDLSDVQEREFRKAFASDFKKHVDAIADRYIRPDEGTLDFALLYVPAENIYYEAILRDERLGEPLGINSYALKKRVIPVSPNSLYAYLQAIVLGLKGLRIEERAREIYAFLARFKSELQKLEEEFSLVGKHLLNAASAFEKGQKRLEKVQGRVAEIDEGSSAGLATPDQPLPIPEGHSS
jgi:DNA recombination protein RmuC